MTKKTYYSKTVPLIWAVAVLRDDFRMTYADIGKRLGKTASTVRHLYLEFDNIKNKKLLWSTYFTLASHWLPL